MVWCRLSARLLDLGLEHVQRGSSQPSRPGLLISEKGPVMGAEIRDSVTKRPAPHRQYLPTETRTAVGFPGPRREWGLYPGEPEACRRQVLPFLRSMLQLGLLVAIFKRYQIEGRAFLALATLALGALPVHYLSLIHI